MEGEDYKVKLEGDLGKVSRPDGWFHASFRTENTKMHLSIFTEFEMHNAPEYLAAARESLDKLEAVLKRVTPKKVAHPGEVP